MRITDNILFNNFLYNINKVNERSYKNNQEMSSGKRLNDLSSDPISLSKVLSLKDINSRFEQYTTNINSANAVFDAEDTTLANVDTLIQNAGALLIKGANSINNDEASSTAISQELDAIKEEIKNSANTVFQGKYIFSGYKTDIAPIQNKVAEAAITDKNGTNAEIAVADNYKDINQFDSGNYTIKIEGEKLSILNANGDTIPIDDSGSDESNVGGNILATQINLSDKADQWIDTGRGIKIKLSEDDINLSEVQISYTAGGSNLYLGDDGERNVEYSDKLSSPVNITAKSIYKPTNQTLENNNYLIDKNTQGAATKETKLTDIMLTESLKNVALETGYKIAINGNDHNGNLVKGEVSATSDMTLASFTKVVTSLDSTEVLENNKVFTLPGNKFATASTKLSSLGISSNINFSGNKHSSGAGATVSATFPCSAASTLGNLATFISNNFDVTAQIKHGIIDLTDSASGASSLRVNAETQDHTPVLGVFYETSKGGSGGFQNVVDASVKDGRLNFVDKRPSESKFNLEFNVSDASGNPKPNIFGVFNTKTYGQGVDVFKELENASSALKNPDSFNQIGIPTNWSEGTTLTPTVSGKYFGGNNDTWNVKVTQGSNDMAQNGAESKLIVRDSLNNTVANIDIKRNGGKYDIKVTDKDGKIIYNATQQNDLSKIVIESKGAQDNFNDEGVNGTAGVTLNLIKTDSTPSFVAGDSFSFKLSNAVQDSIGKSHKMLSQILSSRAIIGARTKRFQLAESRITTTKISNLKTVSDLEDANMAEVFSEYQRNQVVMQATLNIGAKLTAHSLFDYL